MERLQVEAIGDGCRHRTNVLDESAIERHQSNEAPDVVDSGRSRP